MFAGFIIMFVSTVSEYHEILIDITAHISPPQYLPSVAATRSCSSPGLSRVSAPPAPPCQVRKPSNLLHSRSEIFVVFALSFWYNIFFPCKLSSIYYCEHVDFGPQKQSPDRILLNECLGVQGWECWLTGTLTTRREAMPWE